MSIEDELRADLHALTSAVHEEASHLLKMVEGVDQSLKQEITLVCDHAKNALKILKK